jgi:acylphosphatase
MAVCKHVYYWGKVQGVGFRYTVARLAQHHPVAGYVRNLLDGQVELIVEGDAAEVDRFLAAVASQMSGYIKGHTALDKTPQGFDKFEIRA